MNRNRLILVFFTLIALLVPLGPAYAGEDSMAGEPPAEGMIPCERPAGADGVDEANSCPPNPPPPPPPPPPRDTPDYEPYGWHGEITWDGYIRGWACDPNDFNFPIDVHFYADNGRGWHGFIGATTAGDWWNEGVAGACGGNPWHGYTFRIPDWIRNGEGYQLYSYAINLCGSECWYGNPRQQGDGAIFGFGVPADLESSPTLTPNGYTESTQWLANDPVCGSGWTYKYYKTMTISKGLGLWHRKLRLYTVWCATGGSGDRNRITGFRASVWTEHGGWCENTQKESYARTDGGVGDTYVEFQAIAYVQCYSWPFKIPSFNRTLMMRVRYYANRMVVTQDYHRG